jgi:mannose-6-phosphate isomerase-like protein (cupin superfamily)
MTGPIRRVVTGHTPDGRAIVLHDGPAKAFPDLGQKGMTLFDIWRLAAVPSNLAADEPDPVEVPLDFEIPTRGIRLRYLDYPPALPDSQPFMHRTASIDFAVVISGEMTMLMDEDETVLKAGDVVVQRGTNHAWVNRGADVCRMLFVIIGAGIEPELADRLRRRP